jgi:hypothetical protein
MKINGIYKNLFDKNLYARVIEIDLGDLKIHYIGSPAKEMYWVLHRNFIKEFEYIEAKNYHKDSYLQKMLDEEEIRDIIE